MLRHSLFTMRSYGTAVSIIRQYLLFLSMTGVGIAWASILSMPYAMLSGALPPNRVGIYRGIFNFFINAGSCRYAALDG